MESRITASRPSCLFAHAGNLLHAIDVDGDGAIFIPTSRHLVSDTAFIDGRSDIATGPPEFARISELKRATPQEPTPARFVFHLSFCGSTLLSRLIDVEGQSMVLKEPNCLVDLANWKSAQLRTGRQTDRLRPILSLACDLLRRPFALGEAVTVKPSSWVNNILDDLVAVEDGMLPIFVTIDRAAFLQAVFRGGTERLKYTAQLASHMASGFANGDRLLGAAVQGADDPLGQAANLALVAHHCQLLAFERAMNRGGWGGDHVIDFQSIIESPFSAAWKACRSLRLTVERSDLEHSVKQNAGKHSKEPNIGYSAAKRTADDRIILDHHRSTFEAALQWADRKVGTELELASSSRIAA